MKNNLIILSMLLGFLQLNGQCTETGSKWEISWESCETQASPNTDLPAAHWILYDLGSVYTISELLVFNHNFEPNKGFNGTTVHFSNDRTNWYLAWNGNLPMASGQENYAGFKIDAFNTIEARYVLLSAQSNHGDPSCAGISEIQLTAFEKGNDSPNDENNGFVVSFYPNPTSGSVTLLGLQQRSQIQAFAMNGQLVRSFSLQDGQSEINLSGLSAGFYVLRIVDLESGSSVSRKIIKTAD